MSNDLALIIAIAAAVAAIISALFTGMSVRYLASQTRVLTEQAKLQSDQTRLMYAASELTFNLDVMVRLQEVLLHVADDDAIHKEIWGESNEINGCTSPEKLCWMC
jgi:hypothetical protein